MIDDSLLSILACPIDKQALLYFPDEPMLYNPRLCRAYKVEADVPVLLASSAVPVAPDEHQRMIDRARRGEASATRGASAKTLAAED